MSLNFFDYSFSTFKEEFFSTKLGQIYLGIPWDELIKSLNIKTHKKGPQSYFSPRGKLALMFLKHYTCCSDELLLEQLNANLHYQFFCDIFLPIGKKLSNFKIISEIRCELAENLNIEELQQVFSGHWLPYMEDLRSAVSDATCYESAVRYPTDQKLLWECVDWTYHLLVTLCSDLRIKQPRSKYRKWQLRYSCYSRKRRKSAKERRVLTRALLQLLLKLNNELDKILSENEVLLSPKYYKQQALTKQVYQQQNTLFTTGQHPKGRIISLAKPYLRPIVRGKESKRVEYGAKVNKLQIDGISFIQKLSFEAFNEGTQFKNSVFYAQKLTGKKLYTMGADTIYATNANRKFATKNNISTDFCRKGRAGKHEAERASLAKAIKKERSTRLEGSFGKDKMHYDLQNIRARTEKTEILWIFFGIHTSNALEIGRRITRARQKAKAA